MLVYPPSEDSELLLEVALKEVREDDEVLEVGVGSGFVSSRLIGKCKSVIGTDISPFAVKEAKSKGLEVVRTDIARGLRKKFSLILFNPPYLQLEDFEKCGDWIEKAIDGGKYGIEIILKFLEQVGEVMDDESRIILILSSTNSPHIMEKPESEFLIEVIGRKKMFFEELFALKLKKKK
jgi:release factor glutamine methyltransferase